MSEHNVENFMKLATDEHSEGSDFFATADLYYQDAYLAIASGKKAYWNWSAAICGSFWMIYRKMFFYQFLYLLMIVLVMITLVLSTPMSIPLVLVIYIIGSILIMGFYGNYLYVGHIHSKIDKGYHLCSLQNTSAIAALIFWLTCFEMPVYLLINLIIYFSDKRKVKKVLEEKVRTYP